jgi:hypothetical protein
MKLSVFKIEDVSSDDYNAVRLTMFVGTNASLAAMTFTKTIFDNSDSAVMYRFFASKLGDEEIWECNDDFSDCLVIADDSLTARRVKLPKPFYRFERNKKGVFVKSSDERIVRYMKVVCFPGEDEQSQIDRYVANVPDDCWVDEEE